MTIIKIINSSLLYSGLFVFLIISGQRSIMAASTSLTFENCQKKLLDGASLDELSQELSQSAEDKKANQETLDLINELKRSRSCLRLLKQGLLKTNGLLKERNMVASKVLETFVKFHTNWVTPVDYDSPPACQSKFQNDVFDPRGPSYHLTRALFQTDRKASMAIQAYGDLRSIRKGENPKVSEVTNVSAENYQNKLGLKEPLPLTGNEQLIGFLYKKAISFKNVTSLDWTKTNKSWSQSRQKGEFPLYKHLGAGLLGSPSFILHYAPPAAYTSSLYKSDGRTNLPRKLAQGILKNLLCLDPINFRAPADLPKKNFWNHPITQETRCLNCHHTMDHMAAGLRHITFLKSQGTCSEENPQILIPSNFETSYSQDLWQKEPSNLKEENTTEESTFSFSYPVGNFKGERFVGLNQLGRLLAGQEDFYRCQVERYYNFLYEKDIDKALREKLMTSYKEHQNGIKLFEDLLKAPPKSKAQQ